MLTPILLAEDDPRDIELTLVVIRKSQLQGEVVVVRDGVEALEYLAAEGAHVNREPGLPGVILLDIKMPKLNGVEVLSKIRSHPEWASIPVVMLTSSRAEIDIIESYRLGVHAYVIKPVAAHDLLGALVGLES